MNSPHLIDEPLDVAAIAAALRSCGDDLDRRFDVDVLDECESTNSLLMARAEQGAASGSVIVARNQTAGRGRRGRQWLSAPGDSLTFSLLRRFPPQASLEGLSLAVGVALAQSLESIGVHGIALKWPNDLLLDGRKLAGVLIELVPAPRPNAAVIGIGLNLYLPHNLPGDLRQSTAALGNETLPAPPINLLLARLLAGLHEVLETFSHRGFADLRTAWRIRHAHENMAIRLLSDFSPPLDGICRGVDADGALLLETANGMQRIVSGEVSLRSS